MALIRFVFGIIITILITAFAVMNRFDVLMNWSPVNAPITLPFYVILAGALLVGFVFGGVLVWLNGGYVRHIKRKQAKEIKLLEREIDRLKQDQHIKKIAPVAEFFPALKNNT